MTNVWISNPETGASVEVPESALPMYRQSGWDLLPKKDVAALEKTSREDLAAVEADMTPATDAAPPVQDITPPKETS